eukprot:CAMPEP_0171069340 /NCGR_PEP_ID=MMETSP0766_2-20121228/9089_1 /TAXON_ID=439317 /ORGANISM="Gambierdiscus australes, Strain CAWD 149" /LENGTH=143 /DNA_ID=CAMNT_0011525715 /DNA_START=300 /DNA_END=728 /DNA_ORIENTATION=+
MCLQVGPWCQSREECRLLTPVQVPVAANSLHLQQQSAGRRAAAPGQGFGVIAQAKDGELAPDAGAPSQGPVMAAYLGPAMASAAGVRLQRVKLRADGAPILLQPLDPRKVAWLVPGLSGQPRAHVTRTLQGLYPEATAPANGL